MKPSAPLFIVALVPSVIFAEGTLTRGIIESSALGVSKNFNIYLPDGYADGNSRYPVIYLAHGWGVTEDSWVSPSLKVHKIADSKNLQVIIVMPDGDRGAYVKAVDPVDYDACMNEKPPLAIRESHGWNFASAQPITKATWSRT